MQEQAVLRQGQARTWGAGEELRVVAVGLAERGQHRRVTLADGRCGVVWSLQRGGNRTVGCQWAVKGGRGNKSRVAATLHSGLRLCSGSRSLP